MKEVFGMLKTRLAGGWLGEGFAKFPTIEPTGYRELTEFTPDIYKDAIFFDQKAWYKNGTDKDGETVFWDVGFIILRDEDIVLHTVQVTGRVEIYELTNYEEGRFTFDSKQIFVDPKATRSQRILSVSENWFHYEFNMATRQVPEFQNHLIADLKRSL